MIATIKCNTCGATGHAQAWEEEDTNAAGLDDRYAPDWDEATGDVTCPHEDVEIVGLEHEDIYDD